MTELAAESKTGPDKIEQMFTDANQVAEQAARNHSTVMEAMTVNRIPDLGVVAFQQMGDRLHVRFTDSKSAESSLQGVEVDIHYKVSESKSQITTLEQDDQQPSTLSYPFESSGDSRGGEYVFTKDEDGNDVILPAAMASTDRGEAFSIEGGTKQNRHQTIVYYYHPAVDGTAGGFQTVGGEPVDPTRLAEAAEVVRKLAEHYAGRGKM